MALCDERAEWNLIVLAEKKIVIKNFMFYQVVLFTATATDFPMKMETAPSLCDIFL